MRKRFQDKVVLITGASAGIGAETARQLAAEGACLALVARRGDKLAGVKAEVEALGAPALMFVADVNDRAALDAAVAGTLEAFGRIDIVLANAGFGIAAPFHKLTVEDYRRQFETNFFGLLSTIYAALDALRASRGQLGLLGSVAGVVGTPSASPYNASKFAVNGLGESIYHDLDDLGISVTLIKPGFVDSEIRLLDRHGRPSGKGDPVPSWLVLSTPAAARVILKALYRRKPEVTVTFHGKLFTWCKRFFPGAMRFVIRRTSRRRLPERQGHPGQRESHPADRSDRSGPSDTR